MAGAVVDEHRRHASGCGDPGVIGTEGRRRVDDARSVFGGHEVARDDPECIVDAIHRGCPVQQWFVPGSTQIRPFETGHDFVFGRLLAAEMFGEQRFSEHHEALFIRVAVAGSREHIIDVRPDCQGRVRREGPWRGRPREEVHRQMG